MADIVPSLSGLSAAQFQALVDVPAEVEWLANITNPKTRRAYQNDVAEFSRFAGLQSPAELRTISRAHVIAWRKELEARQLADCSVALRAPSDATASCFLVLDMHSLLLEHFALQMFPMHCPSKFRAGGLFGGSTGIGC